VQNTWIDKELMRDFEAGGTDAYRLCTIADGWVERFGRDILVSFKNQSGREQLTTEFFLWAEAMDFNTQRIFERFLPKRNEEREAPKLILGDSNSRLAHNRNGTWSSLRDRFQWRLLRGFVRRPTRKSKLCSESDIRTSAKLFRLHLFIFRCCSSCGCEDGERGSLTEVARTRTPKLCAQQFTRDRDTSSSPRTFLRFLPRLARKGKKFDLIVLDPPTFSRSHRGKTFKVQSNFESLLGEALEVAGRDARILLSTNCATLNERGLEVMARFCLKASRRAGTFHSEPRPRDFPPASGANSYLADVALAG
jgi:23S rRNA (cytosine1962-C5)-methyltransferase